MRLLIDGNIILDVLQNLDPHVVDSAKIWKLCETDQVEGFVSGLTFSNLVYVMRKELTSEAINEVFKGLSLIFQDNGQGFSEIQLGKTVERTALEPFLLCRNRWLRFRGRHPAVYREPKQVILKGFPYA